jgi:hypothetical protein
LQQERQISTENEQQLAKLQPEQVISTENEQKQAKPQQERQIRQEEEILTENQQIVLAKMIIQRKWHEIEREIHR